MIGLLRRVALLRKVTRSGLWSDGELLCQMTAEWLDGAADGLRRAGAHCYRRGVAAKARREAGS